MNTDHFLAVRIAGSAFAQKKKPCTAFGAEQGAEKALIMTRTDPGHGRSA